MLGIEPGPHMIIEEKPLVWMLVWALVFSNLIAVVMFLAIARQLSLVVRIRGSLLIPMVFVLSIVGSYLATHDWRHLTVLFLLSVLGYSFKRYDWPRAPFVIGIVLGSIAEVSLHQALGIWGPAFFLRPVALVLELLILSSAGFYFWKRKHMEVRVDAS